MNKLGLSALAVLVISTTAAYAADNARDMTCQGKLTEVKDTGGDNLKIGPCTLTIDQYTGVTITDKCRLGEHCTVRARVAKDTRALWIKHAHSARGTTAPDAADRDTCSGELTKYSNFHMVGSCSLSADNAKKVMEVCSLGQQCEITGTTEHCKGVRGACSEMTHITAIKSGNSVAEGEMGPAERKDWYYLLTLSKLLQEFAQCSPHPENTIERDKYWRAYGMKVHELATGIELHATKYVDGRARYESPIAYKYRLYDFVLSTGKSDARKLNSLQCGVQRQYP